MKLADVIKNIKVLQTSGDLDQELSGLCQDSRAVVSGNLFFCVKGVNMDGHRFLAQAAAAGAVAALVEEWPDTNPGLALIQVENVSAVIKEVAGAFYDYPERKLHLIGVVGTNGKTTSTYLMKNILEAAGHRVGLIGTIANIIGDQVLEAHNTTPGTLELQQLFSRMVEAGVEYVVMEVSSHSIHQGRVAGLHFRCGIFTNITQDHLDYHKTFEEYLRVKSQFFVDLPCDSWAAINGDDQYSRQIIAKTKAHVLTYGIEQPVDVKAVNIRIGLEGVEYTATTPQGNLDLKLHLTGYFNVYNSLGILTAALGLGIELSAIKRGLESTTGVPGRFQKVVVPGMDFTVIVDYAHTPDGLENILQTGRGLNPRRLLLVFGCGGDRDRTKRPIMGALAAKMADYSIITSDNPRSEEPLAIIREIESGFKAAETNARYMLEADRALAIRKSILEAQPGDLVMIAGKGHETYQQFADRTIHFDDREVAAAVLKERFNG
ncbi:MAG TPA: UDP-N-acetylmuramoyl-L-alanyl-D-glutamate--2,6-diaminopimelate ligase [Bacillota bacterium]|nr:UDP-N-acetylmuramoyl-L-alanyl-D-glutamate--2,6-diaminopimelate ligase [Bacillota bacterium]